MKYLFLTNDEAKALLALATGKKVSFQFYHDSLNDLTLYAWPKKTGSDTNTDADGIILHKGKDTAVNIDGKNVLLGNLHLGPVHFKTLSDVCQSNKFAYIIFYPVIGLIDNSAISHVYYDIYGDYVLPAVFKILPLAQLITSTKNPSPPRPSN
jgi:hypothetical protein